jgi:hypothetical protein
MHSSVSVVIPSRLRSSEIDTSCNMRPVSSVHVVCGRHFAKTKSYGNST